MAITDMSELEKWKTDTISRITDITGGDELELESQLVLVRLYGRADDNWRGYVSSADDQGVTDSDGQDYQYGQLNVDTLAKLLEELEMGRYERVPLVEFE